MKKENSIKGRRSFVFSNAITITILYYIIIYYILYTIYYILYTIYYILYTILYYTILYYTITYYTITYCSQLR